MKVVWKRLIDQSDPTRDPAMRFALKGDYLAVVKEDFDRKAIYMLSSRTGEVLWHTDPKKADSPQPLYSMIMEGDALYGLQVHPGQGFYFAGLDCKTGKPLFKRTEEAGYQGKPEAKLLPRLFGPHAVALVRDGQDFEVKVFDVAAAASCCTRVAAKGRRRLGRARPRLGDRAERQAGAVEQGQAEDRVQHPAVGRLSLRERVRVRGIGKKHVPSFSATRGAEPETAVGWWRIDDGLPGFGWARESPLILDADETMMEVVGIEKRNPYLPPRSTGSSSGSILRSRHSRGLLLGPALFGRHFSGGRGGPIR